MKERDSLVLSLITMKISSATSVICSFLIRDRCVNMYPGAQATNNVPSLAFVIHALK